MKIINKSVIFLLCLALSQFGLAKDGSYRKSLDLCLDAYTMKLSEGNDRSPEMLVKNGISVTVTLKGTPASGTTFECEYTKDGAAPVAAADKIMGTLINDGQSFPFNVDGDGKLKVTRKCAGMSSGVQIIKLITPEPTKFVTALTTGATYSSNHRSTFSLQTAFDSSGNVIPNKKQIVERRNDKSIDPGINGAIYYLFGEDQEGVVDIFQRILSLSLHKPGDTRCGLVFGLSSSSQTAPSYQIGFSFFPDKQERIAISYGFNFTQGQSLTSGFKTGDIVSFPDLSGVTKSSWESGFFFGISLKLDTGSTSGKNK